MAQRPGHELAPDATGTDLGRPLRIVLATPCTDVVKAGFALDLAKLTATVAASGIDAAIVHNRGTIIPEQRQVLAETALDMDASHVLFIDSDMRFPKDGLFRLLAHQQPIVGVNYPRRREPFLPTAQHQEHGYLFTDDKAEGLTEVTQLGFGFVLIDTRVFEAMPKPWFAIGYSKTGNYVGEDVFFCSRARIAGFRVLVDHDLSKAITHTGDMEYTQAHANAHRPTLVVTEDAYCGA